MLDELARIPAADALEAQFSAIIARAGDHELLARFWWNILHAERAFHLHEAPWRIVQHSATLEAIAGATGGELYAEVSRMWRGLCAWCLGEADAERQLGGAASVDARMGIASALLLALGYYWMGAPETTKIKVGMEAPELELPSVNPGSVKLSSFRGQAVLLAFFMSDCHICQKEIGEIIEKD